MSSYCGDNTRRESKGQKPPTTWKGQRLLLGSSNKNFQGQDPASSLVGSAALLPFRFIGKALLGTTIALYVLNQKHLLPRPISSVVSKLLFWPTLPITVSKRIGNWITPVDDTVVLGGAPFGFAGIPEELYSKYDVRGVINLCEEYRGPVEKYKRLGIEELYLPTTDHFEPELEDLFSAVKFIKKFEKAGERVYVHCRAGHGRSAAVTFAWLITKNQGVDTKELNEDLVHLRDVRRTLWKQKNIRRFKEIWKG